MLFLFISDYGKSISIADRIQREGNRCLFYINIEECRRAGNGIVEKHQCQELLISDKEYNKKVLEKLLDPKPDCVIVDMTGYGYGKAADTIRKKGIPCIGTSEWADKLEKDRVFGIQVMKTMKIDQPKTYSFTDFDKAIKFVEDKNEPFVYKPCGEVSTTTTYVAKGADDLIGMLEFYSKEQSEEFELQEIKKGVEVSNEIWFNGTNVININHTMEEKSLLPDGIGPKTGCMGSVVWEGSGESRLYKEGIAKMIPLLRKVKYVGCMDLNTIVDKEKIYGLEFTPRFGYDALFVFLEMYGGRLSNLFHGVSSGKLNSIKFRSPLGIGVDLSVPPNPMTNVKSDIYKDIPIIGLTPELLKHTWLSDVYKKDGKYVVAGNGGDVMCVTARGENMDSYSPLRDATRRVYRTISNITVPDMMYRKDIGQRVEGDKAKLKAWGWL